MYKVCKGLTSPLRPFHILPHPKRVSHERFNFLFPPSHSRCYGSAHSTAHTLTPFQTKCLATCSEVFTSERIWVDFLTFVTSLVWALNEFDVQREKLWFSTTLILLLRKSKRMMLMWIEGFPWTKQILWRRSFISFSVCFSSTAFVLHPNHSYISVPSPHSKVPFHFPWNEKCFFCDSYHNSAGVLLPIYSYVPKSCALIIMDPADFVSIKSKSYTSPASTFFFMWKHIKLQRMTTVLKPLLLTFGWLWWSCVLISMLSFAFSFATAMAQGIPKSVSWLIP